MMVRFLDTIQFLKIFPTPGRIYKLSNFKNMVFIKFKMILLKKKKYANITMFKNISKRLSFGEHLIPYV